MTTKQLCELSGIPFNNNSMTKLKKMYELEKIGDNNYKVLNRYYTIQELCTLLGFEYNSGNPSRSIKEIEKQHKIERIDNSKRYIYIRELTDEEKEVYKTCSLLKQYLYDDIMLHLQNASDYILPQYTKRELLHMLGVVNRNYLLFVPTEDELDELPKRKLVLEEYNVLEEDWDVANQNLMLFEEGVHPVLSTCLTSTLNDLRNQSYILIDSYLWGNFKDEIMGENGKRSTIRHSDQITVTEDGCGKPEIEEAYLKYRNEWLQNQREKNGKDITIDEVNTNYFYRRAMKGYVDYSLHKEFPTLQYTFSKYVIKVAREPMKEYVIRNGITDLPELDKVVNAEAFYKATHSLQGDLKHLSLENKIECANILIKS